MPLILGILSFLCLKAAPEPDWVQLRIFSAADTVEINFPAVLVKQSSALMPENVRITMDKDAIDLVERMNDLDKDHSKLLEISGDSGRVEMGFIPVNTIRTRSNHPPRDFRIEAENFHLRASLPILKLFVKSLAGDSDENLKFFTELGKAITKPGRYSIMRVKNGEEKLKIFLE